MSDLVKCVTYRSQYWHCDDCGWVGEEDWGTLPSAEEAARKYLQWGYPKARVLRVEEIEIPVRELYGPVSEPD